MPDPTVPLPAIAPGQHPAGRLRAIQAVRWAAFGSLVGLIALGLLWELTWAPTGAGSLAVKVVPLTLGIAGLLKHRLYTFRWLSLLVWLYFAEGVMRLSGDRGLSQVLAGVEVALSLVLFTACAVYVRLRLKAGKGLPAATA